VLEHLFFFIGLTLLFLHEMDAIWQKEWRLFIFLSALEEENAYRVFTALHLPLYLLIFWGVWGGTKLELNPHFILGLNLFFMIHVGLHFLFRKHPHYLFHSHFSRFLIVGTGLCGLLDVTLHL
jgi:hypothetical protein